MAGNSAECTLCRANISVFSGSVVPLIKNVKFSFFGLLSETRDFPTVISLIHTFFYHLLFLWLLFLSLIENWPRLSILSSEEGFDSLAPQLSLGWQVPLLFWAGRQKSSAQLCRWGSSAAFNRGSVWLSVLFPAQKSTALLLDSWLESSPGCQWWCSPLSLQLLDLVQRLEDLRVTVSAFLPAQCVTFCLSVVKQYFLLLALQSHCLHYA